MSTHHAATSGLLALALAGCGSVGTDPGTPSDGTVTVIVDGDGSGTVTSSPAGIDCGSDCSEEFEPDSTVTLTAAPAAASGFAGWSGAGCSGTGTCVVTAGEPATVTASFGGPRQQLTVTLGGRGVGIVSSEPAGINCGDDCSEAFPVDSVVTLTAAPSTGFFSSWSGADCEGPEPCEVTVTEELEVSASFGLPLPDSHTASCTDGTAAVACPGGVAGQDGSYEIEVPNYVTAGGTVTDSVTQLVWEQSPPTANVAEWDAALAYCADLEVGDASDWRLPSRLELVSLVDAGRVGPAFDVTAFPGIPQNSFYWTSTEVPGDQTSSFAIGTNYPVVQAISKSGATGMLVRCVRGAPFDGKLTAARGSVTDGRTGLVWQSGVAPAPLSWQDALAYCEDLSLDGASTWRLPSMKELASIADDTVSAPAISTLFAERPSAVFWTSTPLANGPASGYAIDFTNGASSGIDHEFAISYDVRCVR